MKFATTLIIFLSASVMIADQVVDPPVTAETLVGTWEALPEQHPPLLWHMEIKKEGVSYLAQITAGTGCIVRPLLSSEIKDGRIRLHFGKASSKEMPNDAAPDIWVIGKGSAVADPPRGVIEWKSNDAPADAAKLGVYFIKGTWTRDVAEASKVAEKAIKEQTPSPK